MLHSHRRQAAAQRTPQPIFTELFTYDPATPSQLLGKWLSSSQLDSKLQPLRVGVVEDRIGKTVGRITVEEGDGLTGANEAMLQARDYICNSEGSRVQPRRVAHRHGVIGQHGTDLGRRDGEGDRGAARAPVGCVVCRL